MSSNKLHLPSTALKMQERIVHAISNLESQYVCNWLGFKIQDVEKVLLEIRLFKRAKELRQMTKRGKNV